MHYDHRVKRSASSFYGDVTSSTGGNLYQITKNELAVTLQKVFEVSLESVIIPLLIFSTVS